MKCEILFEIDVPEQGSLATASIVAIPLKARNEIRKSV